MNVILLHIKSWWPSRFICGPRWFLRLAWWFVIAQSDLAGCPITHAPPSKDKWSDRWLALFNWTSPKRILHILFLYDLISVYSQDYNPPAITLQNYLRVVALGGTFKSSKSSKGTSCISKSSSIFSQSTAHSLLATLCSKRVFFLILRNRVQYRLIMSIVRKATATKMAPTIAGCWNS